MQRKSHRVSSFSFHVIDDLLCAGASSRAPQSCFHVFNSHFMNNACRHFYLSTIFACALALGACGGGGSDPASAANASNSTESATTASSTATNTAANIVASITSNVAPKAAASSTASNSPCSASASSNTAYACTLTSVLSGPLVWSLNNAPTGMRIQPRSGILHWTPLAAQTGSYTVHAIASNGQQTQDVALSIQVIAGGADPEGLYVSPDGNDSNVGSSDRPFLTLLQAVKRVKPGQTIYMRGGEYRNSEYGQDWASRTRSNLAQISTSGTASDPITLRPLGNEYVRLVSDVTGISIKSANYWTIQGLELVGAAPSLNLATVLSRWWSDPGNSLGGAGIANSGGDHLTIADCVIHDFPDSGISSNSAEYLNVSNNVVYNNAWWSTGGTHGISVSQMISTATGSGQPVDSRSCRRYPPPPGVSQQTIRIMGNLVFGNQSLVISHVFSKGKVTLAIDEGNGLHLQNSGNTYSGVTLVANNLMAFNGKAGLGINTMRDVELLNNDFYLNARTVDTGELRMQSSPMFVAAGNLFQPRPERVTIDDGDKVYANVGSNATTGAASDGALYPSIQRLSAVFKAPGEMDFLPATSVPVAMGVPASDLARMTTRMSEYGIQFTAPTQVIDSAYLASMKASIFSTWPAAYNTLQLADPATGFTYVYNQRCHYPAAPGSNVCP